MVDDGSTVGWLRPGDRLVLACLCGAETTLGRGDLIRLLGTAAPLDLIGLRVRCARCGQQPCNGWDTCWRSRRVAWRRTFLQEIGLASMTRNRTQPTKGSRIIQL